MEGDGINGEIASDRDDPAAYPRSFRISRAAFSAGPPVTPPPGCVPAPHMYSPATGDRYRAHPMSGRDRNSWSSDGD